MVTAARSTKVATMRSRLASLCICLSLAGCAARRAGGDDSDEPDDDGAENCANGYDDDGDHTVDCFDPDCVALPACAPPEACDNAFDDDRDGWTDCADPQCLGVPECDDATEADCADERDDDADGAIDCADPDCVAVPACEPAVDEEIDCEAICDREAACGTDLAGPDCLASCQCSVDEMLAPDVAASYFECRRTTECAALDDPNACAGALETTPTPAAADVIDLCQTREDCAGFPCDMLGVFNDDRQEELSTCLVRSDCLSCIEQVSAICG